MWRIAVLAAGLAGAPGQLSAQSSSVRRLSAAQLFDLAEHEISAHRPNAAITIYEGLSRDPELEVRSEARFREGMLLASVKRYAEAAGKFRKFLDEKPGTARVELELARVLNALGDEEGARRAIRQAQATGLPDDVAAVVDQFAVALHSPQRAGGSLEVALAPDSNVNRATSARTLDTIIAPLTLSDDARERSGLGITINGQAFARQALASNIAFFPRASYSSTLYRESRFNDSSASLQLGLEYQLGRDRITPSIGPGWRWYGNHPYANTTTASLGALHPIGRRSQLTFNASVARARYRQNKLQDGHLAGLSLAFEHAVSGNTYVGGSMGLIRQSAADPGYSTTSASFGLFASRDSGFITIFANSSLQRTIGDARLVLFPDRRREWLKQVALGAIFRKISFLKLAPTVRLTYEQNTSTVGLYRYHRLSTQFGLSRTF